MTVHLSEIADAAEKFAPDAIVMSGTFADFDYYNPDHIASFKKFIQETKFLCLRSAVRINWSQWHLGRRLKRLTI